ncbi:MAG: hypothetical protein ACR65O_03705 [Methylomicrobium sp.]
MNWQEQDNKQQRGKIDRIYVSPTEYYELHHFVDHYLQNNNYLVNDKNRQIVIDAINTLPQKSPVQRDTLTRYLNDKFKK